MCPILSERVLAEHNVRTGFFEREQFEEVRGHLPADLPPVATFAHFTGWHTHFALERRQVDVQTGTVRLEPPTTKSSEGRIFPFGDAQRALGDVLLEGAMASRRWCLRRESNPHAG